jgi:indolepyruvate ferredoxin oxidoreductase alpha subunit
MERDMNLVKKLLSGNEAVAQGALESGVEVVTGYPGTPSSEVIPYLAHIVKKENLRVHAEWSVNEKVAFDIATAAAWSGKRSLVTMKMAGLNVASDTLINIANKGVKGGMVIYVADDPGTHAGCTEQDSRFYSFLSLVPILDPSDPMDTKKLIKIAFKISEKMQIPIILRSTTNVSHAIGIVECSHYCSSLKEFEFKKDAQTYTTVLADRVSQRELLIKKNIEALELFDKFNLNKLDVKSNLGVIASGVSWTYLQEIINYFSLELSTFKIDSENPWPESKVSKLIESVDKILVLEEQEPIVETMLKKSMVNAKRIIPVLGKEDDTISRVGENNLENVANAISKLIDKKLEFKEKIQIDTKKLESFQSKETLTFCEGCPHRATYYIINKAVKKLGFKKDEVIVTGDIGCTSIGVYKPLETLWTEVTMGASIGLAYGFKISGAKKPVIATIGDSTFFHSGIAPLINAVQYDCDLTVVVLDNLWTSMTGFQPNPNTGLDLFGEPSKMVSISSITEAIGAFTITISPFEIEKSINIVAETITKKGVKVIISKEECALQKIRHISKDQPYYIDQEKCIKCDLCLRNTFCPAIVHDKNRYYIDKNICTGCGLCAYICPVNAIMKEEN